MGLNLREPIASHMLWSMLIVMLLAMRRLARPSVVT
jgi:hypothetical protein